MAKIITVSQIQEHLESDLPDSVVQRLLDDADQAIVERYGPHGSATEGIEDDLETNSEILIFPRRPIASMISVTEWTSNTISRGLNGSDFRLMYGGKAIKRLTTGDTPATVWGWRVQLTYLASTEDNARRRRVCIDLVRLGLAHDGLLSETAGDYSKQNVNYQREREKILNELGGVRVY